MFGEVGLDEFGDFGIVRAGHAFEDGPEEFNVIGDVGDGHEGEVFAAHFEEFFDGGAVGAEEFLGVEFEGLGFGPIGFFVALTEGVEEPGAHVEAGEEVRPIVDAPIGAFEEGAGDAGGSDFAGLHFGEQLSDGGGIEAVAEAGVEAAEGLGGGGADEGAGMVEEVSVGLGVGGPIGDGPAVIGPPEHGGFFVGEGDGEFEGRHLDVAFEAALAHEPIDGGLGGRALAAGLGAEDDPAEGTDAFVALGGDPVDVKADEVFEFVFFDGVGLEGPAIGEGEGDLAGGAVAEDGTFAGLEPGERFRGDAGEGGDTVFPIGGVEAGVNLTLGREFGEFIGAGKAADSRFEFASERSFHHA